MSALATCTPVEAAAVQDVDGPVVVVIVGYRNPEDIRACLGSLTRLSYRNFVVTICENGGTKAYAGLLDALAELVTFDRSPLPPVGQGGVTARFGRLNAGGQTVRIYQASENLGYGGGINLVLRQLEADPDWSSLWILNPDTEPDANALSALVERAGQGYGIVGSRLMFKTSGRVQSFGGYWRLWMASARNLGMNAGADTIPDIDAVERSINYVSGASLFATRACAKRIGLFDERYFLYCEEIDWIFRRGDFRLGYAHEAVVYHAHGATIGSNKNRRLRSTLSVYLDERNRHLFTRKFYPTHYPLVALTTLVFTLQYLRAGAIGNFLVALQGWGAGILGEEGPPKRFMPHEAEP